MVSFSTSLKQQSVPLRLSNNDEVVTPPAEPESSVEEDEEVSMSFLAILLRCLSAMNV